MKQIQKTSNSLAKLAYILMFLFPLLTFSSCDTLDIPEEGSIVDKTPPAASFSAKSDPADFKTINFSNLSISATDYSWDFGDNNTSTEAEPSHTYSGEGDYTVTLTASDKKNAKSVFTQVVTVEDLFIPVILNPGFDIVGDDEYRDNWRNGDLGGVIQITDGPVFEGEKAAKLPNDGSRIGYQLITVQPDKNYTVSFYYTMKTDPVGSLTVSILAGAVIDPNEVAGKTIESVTVNDQTSASSYVPASVTFDSGDNTEVAIFFTNVGAECRIDSFKITKN